MTLTELKERIDSIVGMPSEYITKRPDKGELVYKSPTGIPLLRLTVFDDGGWRCGGHQASLDRLFEEKLQQLHRA